jgi:murein DD-endopeptidase MepM/ murein hydrolase activator NlpD
MTGHVTPRPWRVARFARAAAVALAVLSGAAAVGAEMSQVGGAATVAATAERRVVEGQGVMFPMATSPKCLIFNNFGGFSGVFGSGGHQGVDIGATLGQAVYAVEDGVLYRKFTDLASAAGNGWGLIGASDTQYRYYHLSGFAEGLAQGDRVQRGQLIGYVGDTGNATPGGYHLHFELRPGPTYATPVDPVPLLAIPAACTLYPKQ